MLVVLVGDDDEAGIVEEVISLKGGADVVRLWSTGSVPFWILASLGGVEKAGFGAPCGGLDGPVTGGEFGTGSRAPLS